MEKDLGRGFWWEIWSRPFFKSLFVYRVFLRFESELSTKGNRQIPQRISRWQRCSAVIGPDQLPSRTLPSRNSLSAINERTFGKRSRIYKSMKGAGFAWFSEGEVVSAELEEGTYFKVLM